jgi:NitT/TauT family transport system substrate-binding protein
MNLKESTDPKIVRIGYQLSMGFLPVAVMIRDRLIEKRAIELGLNNLKVSALVMGSGQAITDALLRREIEIGGVGLTPFIALWESTLGKENVKAIAPLNDSPLYLVSLAPELRSLDLLTAAHKIAVPSLDSVQTIYLRMLAENRNSTVSGYDSMLQVLSGSEMVKEVLSPQPSIQGVVVDNLPTNLSSMIPSGVAELANSYQLIEGGHNLTMLVAASAWKEENPELYLAIEGAIADALSIINDDPVRAGIIWRETMQGQVSAELVGQVLARGEASFSSIPRGIMEFAQFMHKTAMIRTLPSDWQEMFFDAH